MSKSNKHILVYPYPTAGHIIPILDLTHNLLTAGLTVTILITPNNRPLLDPLISRHASSSLLHPLLLPTPAVSPSPTQSKPLLLMRGLRDLHQPLLLHWFKSHSSPPVVIVSDIFLGWTQELASQIGVARVVFSPSGAFAYSISASLWRDRLDLKDVDVVDVDFEVSFPGVPGRPVFPWHQISHLYRSHTRGDSDWEACRHDFMSNSLSWGLIFNSFTELERVYIEHLKKEIGHDRVWAVGPLLPPNEDDTTTAVNRGGTSSVPFNEVMSWLDGRKSNSVVYVCFGSRVTLTSKIKKELASALEQSGVQFIWSINGSTVAEDGGDFPHGFEDRVTGRGFLIKGWAPQVSILRHDAVGAFLSHCGWNSTLEGISAGVVFLTWPMDADQFSNAKLLVDELGVGIRVGEGDRNIPESMRLSRLLVESIDESRPEKKRATKLREAALDAVHGGSSGIELDEFLEKVEGRTGEAEPNQIVKTEKSQRF